MSIAIIPNNNGTVDMQVAGVNGITMASAGGISTLRFSDATTQTTAALTLAELNEDFEASLTATGYQKFSSGIIIQWIAAGSGVRSWAIPFPNAVFGAWYTPTNIGTSVDNAYISTLTTTQVGLSQINSNPTGFILGIGR